jgi:aspartate racemase
VCACTELPVAYQQAGLPADMGISSLEALADGCIRELYKPL